VESNHYDRLPGVQFRGSRLQLSEWNVDGILDCPAVHLGRLANVEQNNLIPFVFEQVSRIRSRNLRNRAELEGVEALGDVY
jgi:hypothetical protein